MEALQVFRCIQLHEVNISLGLADMDFLSLASMPKEYIIPANEANVIVLFDNIQNILLRSQSIIRGLDSIVS